jgi:hypothetical protein
MFGRMSQTVLGGQTFSDGSDSPSNLMYGIWVVSELQYICTGIALVVQKSAIVGLKMLTVQVLLFGGQVL